MLVNRQIRWGRDGNSGTMYNKKPRNYAGFRVFPALSGTVDGVPTGTRRISNNARSDFNKFESLTICESLCENRIGFY